MELKLQSEKDRIFALDESGQTLAEIRFPYHSKNTVDISRTYVSPQLRGQGIADLLVRSLVQELDAKNMKAIPSCSYAAKWFEKHTEYAHLLAT